MKNEKQNIFVMKQKNDDEETPPVFREIQRIERYNGFQDTWLQIELYGNAPRSGLEQLFNDIAIVLAKHYSRPVNILQPQVYKQWDDVFDLGWVSDEY